MSMRMLFDIKCGYCDYFEEDWYGKREEFSDLCHWCGKYSLQILDSMPALIGPRTDKPLHVPNIGKTFTSQAELRAHEKATKTTIVMPTDKSWRDKVDHTYNIVNESVRRKGFSGVEDFRKEIRTKKADRQRIKVDGPKVMK